MIRLMKQSKQKTMKNNRDSIISFQYRSDLQKRWLISVEVPGFKSFLRAKSKKSIGVFEKTDKTAWESDFNLEIFVESCYIKTLH
jgi:hypothetical protein